MGRRVGSIRRHSATTNRAGFFVVTAGAYMIAKRDLIQRLELLRYDALLYGALHFDVLNNNKRQIGSEERKEHPS